MMELLLENNRLTITVRDDGAGIPDVKKAREPLYTTREDEDRAGLGFTIMEIFSDSVEVMSEPERGRRSSARRCLADMDLFRKTSIW